MFLKLSAAAMSYNIWDFAAAHFIQFSYKFFNMFF